MPEMPSGYAGGYVARTYGASAGASSVATPITAAGSANTKGSYVELIAATEFDANWIEVDITNGSSVAAASWLIDIAIGAATEQVIIPDLYARTRGGGGSFGSYLFPIFIPKGSRLTARCQCSTASLVLGVSVHLISGTGLSGGSGPSTVSAYGDVASSAGTNIDPGGTANTDSAWVEIAAATERNHNWLVVSGWFGDGTLAAATVWRLSVGIGAATEQVLIPDLHFSSEVTSDHPYNAVRCFPVFIPAGSRLTARMRCSVNTDGDRDANIKLYGC